MPKITPNEALNHIKEPLTHAPVVPGGCPECLEALAVLRALVEGPTVEEVREEIQRRLNNLPHTEPHDSAHLLGSCVIDFIDQGE